MITKRNLSSNIKDEHFFRHFKGKWYMILNTAEHTETGEQMVIYKALYGENKIYCRPMKMFLDLTDKEKYPDANQEYRFMSIKELIRTIDVIQDKHRERLAGLVVFDDRIKLTHEIYESIEANISAASIDVGPTSEIEVSIMKAIDLAVRYGGIDGEHHKAWVIDQMVRVLAGDRYDDIVRDACDGEEGPDTYEWDCGVAP